MLRELHLEHHPILMPKRNLAQLKVKLPHSAKALVIKRSGFVSILLEPAIPFSESECVMLSQNLDVSDPQSGPFDCSGSFDCIGSAEQACGVFLAPHPPVACLQARREMTLDARTARASNRETAPLRPAQARTNMTPRASALDTIYSDLQKSSAAIAKFSACESFSMKVVMPRRFPAESNSPPPEEPGDMGALV
jgi:hypothetical protein